MKGLFKYLLVLICVFGFTITTVNAAKTTKNEKETTKETKSDKEEVKEDKKSSEKEKVTLYLFRRSGCGHCANEMTFLDTIVNDYKDKLNIVVYDVTQGNNNLLLGAVAEELGVTVQGVPFNVIGTKTQEGFGESMSDQFLEMLDEAYKEQEKDAVAKVIEKNTFSDLKATTLYEAMDEEELEYDSKPGSKAKKDGMVIIAVFTVITVAFGTLIYFSRRK